MGEPTQVLPSWFTISTTVLTDAGGVPTATSESLLYLPLTYFGPSIPLGSLWTYGGLTSPASTSTSPTATPTSATPTTTSSSLTSSPSSSLTSSSPSSSSAFPSPSASNTPVSNGLSRNQLIGIIVGSIIGFIFLFVLLLLLYICCKHRQQRRRDPRFSMVAPQPPIDEDYYIVPPGGESPGEGSPRSSGEVEDSFLRRDEGKKPRQMSNVGPAAAVAAGAGAGAAAVASGSGAEPPSQDNSLGSSSKSSDSAASGYGNVVPTAFGEVAPVPAQRWGPILSREELRRLDEEDEDEQDQDGALVHTTRNVPPARQETKYYDPFDVESHEREHDPEVYPLMPPPRLVDPSRNRSRLTHQPSLGSQLSGDPSEATLHTARRVKAEDLAPRSPPRDSSSNLPTDAAGASGSGRRDSGIWRGLGGLAAGLGRLGWFSSSTSSSRRNSAAAAAWSSTPLADNDVEQARALLNDPSSSTSPPPQMSEFRRPGAGLGLAVTGDRPISGVSAKSGKSTETMYYSAPGTPNRMTPLPTPPPRVLASSSSAAEMGYWPRPPQTPPIPPTGTMTTGQTQTGSTTTAYETANSGTRTTAYETANSGSMDLGLGVDEHGQRHAPPPPPTARPHPSQQIYQHPPTQYYDALTISSTVEPPPYGPGDSGVDILDMPVPRGISPFGSTSSLPIKETQDQVQVQTQGTSMTTPDSSLGSSKKTATTTTSGTTGPSLPPGLGAALTTPSAWHESQTLGTTPSPGSFAARSRNGSVPDLIGSGSGSDRMSTGITIDVLEEAPPKAAERWRDIASSAGGSSGERRLTFGMAQFVRQPYSDLASEIGSLHSMRSNHLSPRSSPGGSAAASRRDLSGSTGSSSSRPSAARSARSVLSGSEGHSLSHSGSISSDGHWKRKLRTTGVGGEGSTTGGAMSPALSVFGHNTRVASGATATSGPSLGIGQYTTSPISEEGSGSVARARVPTPLLGVGSGVTIDGERRGHGHFSAPSSPRIGRSLSPRRHDISPVDRALSLSPVPWAGGLDDSWSAS
ncbi:hypothetical protein K435DRAFT_863021 [Dendrothele bispora CBS 962.96]|uniref:Uncharacterized protein n=1 Tax=Dendrothele bispora (strain CBS 962.96) TaxID=1314807 RepID=A0A4S8LS66_DENBC|nr:hypothetical protein K435DRAFT_863021 [Dendrothele bispora CBS 962.96]